MQARIGIFQNGFIKFDKEYISDTPVKVLVTFLEETHLESNERLTLNHFSFAKSQKNLANFKGSLSDTVIEERRLDV